MANRKYKIRWVICNHNRCKWETLHVKNKKHLDLIKTLKTGIYAIYEKHSKNIDSSWSSKIEKDNATQILSPPQVSIIILMTDEGDF